MAENIEEVVSKGFKEAEKEFSNDNLIVYLEETLTKDEVLKNMVHLIKENSDAIGEENDFLENVMEREKIGSTGVGLGIAIPHARFNGAKKIVIAIALLKTPISFGSLDGEDVKLVVMVGAPKEMGKEYLNLVATLVRAFRNKEYRETVLNAKSSLELKNALEEFK